MKVGATLLQQFNARLLKNFENELRTEALLLGEPYNPANSIARMLLPASRGAYSRSIFDAMSYAMAYGTAMHSTMLKPQGTVTGRVYPPQEFREIGNRIYGRSPGPCVLDDIDFSKLEEQVLKDMTMAGRSLGKPSLMSGIHDEIFMDFTDPVPEQGALPRAEPNRGPQPRKANIHRRK